MPARPLVTALAGSALALVALTGLTACSSATSGSGAAVSEANLSGSPVTVKDDMTALCDQIVAEKLAPETATALAEASGYTTRISSLDGEPQAVTMDLREDRFTFEVTADVVTVCTIG